MYIEEYIFEKIWINIQNKVDKNRLIKTKLTLTSSDFILRVGGSIYIENPVNFLIQRVLVT